MRFGAILDHLEATFIHFGPFEKVKKKSILTSFWPFFGHFWPFWGSFWAHYGPYFAPGSPQSEGGTGPNDTKTSPNGPKMRFGAILDHLEATFIHFVPFGKVNNFSFLTFWSIFGHFWPFWGPFWALLCPWNPQIEGGTGQNATKTGPNGPKMRFGAILDHLEATGIHFDHLEKLIFFRF